MSLCYRPRTFSRTLPYYLSLVDEAGRLSVVVKKNKAGQK